MKRMIIDNEEHELTRNYEMKFEAKVSFKLHIAVPRNINKHESVINYFKKQQRGLNMTDFYGYDCHNTIDLIGKIKIMGVEEEK